jgi:hypothetical protein
MIPLNEFRKNQSQFPLDELEKYNGKYVAWSEDGTHILASDEDMVRLHKTIQEAGYDTGEILIAFVEYPVEISWGCATLFLDEEDQE